MYILLMTETCRAVVRALPLISELQRKVI